MKKLTIQLMIILFTISGLMKNVLAQAPEGIIYQAEARDSKNNLLTNKALDVKISIIQGALTGTVVYEELHKVTTNIFGMFVLVIGQGTSSLTLLKDVEWGKHSHFLNVQVKESKKDAWIDMGTSQLLSVPYALHAKTAANLNDGEQDPVFSAWDKDYEDLINKPDVIGQTPGSQTGQMQYWNGSEWVTVTVGNEGQVLSFTGGIPTWKTIVDLNDVQNPSTGKIWMDRNLGASQVATSSTDVASYGDLYQWGRGTDGHEKRTSGTTSTLSSSDTPGHGYFITSNSGRFDWRSPQNSNLWQGVSGTNNPCPSGYRLPTYAEWEAERLSWSSNNSAGAFGSPLKLPMAGRRYSDGSLYDVGFCGRYYSSTVYNLVTNHYSVYLYFDSSNAYPSFNERVLGLSVRCLKD